LQGFPLFKETLAMELPLKHIENLAEPREFL
jgi:hypothetical protein